MPAKLHFSKAGIKKIGRKMFQSGSLWTRCATKSKRWTMLLGRSTGWKIISSNRETAPCKLGIKFNLIKGTISPLRVNLRRRVSIRCRLRKATFKRYLKSSWPMLRTKWSWGQLVKSTASKSCMEFNKLKVGNNKRIPTIVAEVSTHRERPKYSKKTTKMITIWWRLRKQSITAAKEGVYHTSHLKEIISPLRHNPTISRKVHHRFPLMNTYWRKIRPITWRPMHAQGRINKCQPEVKITSKNPERADTKAPGPSSKKLSNSQTFNNSNNRSMTLYRPDSTATFRPGDPPRGRPWIIEV